MLEQVPGRWDYPNELPKKRVGWDERIYEAIIRTKLPYSPKEYELPENIVDVIERLYRLINEHDDKFERFGAERDKFMYDYYEADTNYKNLGFHAKRFIRSLKQLLIDPRSTKQDIMNKVNEFEEEERLNDF